jgi:hypothetical protein
LRIWNLPFNELDNARVLGQHAEYHAIESRLCSGKIKRWKGWENPDYSWAFYGIHVDILAEMIERGWTQEGHRTPAQPLPWVGADRETQVFHPDQSDPLVINEERWQVLCRNDGQKLGRYYALNSDEVYDELLERWRVIGCQHGQEKIGVTMTKIDGHAAEICLNCKRMYRTIGDPTWYVLPHINARETRNPVRDTGIWFSDAQPTTETHRLWTPTPTPGGRGTALPLHVTPAPTYTDVYSQYIQSWTFPISTPGGYTGTLRNSTWGVTTADDETQ